MDDHGFTLVELILAMTLTIIVTGIVISLLIFNSRSYIFASKEVNLQMESQTVMNQLNDILIEAEWVELTSLDSSWKAMIIYKPSKSSPDVVFFNQTDRKLYLMEVPAASMTDLAKFAKEHCSVNENLMAVNVSDLAIYPADGTYIKDKKQITLRLHFADASSEYDTEQNIKFRNKLVVH